MQLDREERRRLSGFGNAQPGGARRERPDAATAELARMVEAEIIPRLMLAHRSRPGAEPAAPPSPGEVALLADLAVAGDAGALSSCVDAVRDRGVGLEGVLLELLAPAARLLGDRWLSDETSFAEVTIGLSCLHRLLHELVDGYGDVVTAPRAPRALLMPAEGEQHTFGLRMVEAFLRHAGWDVWPSSAGTEDALRLVRQRRFDVVGVSASSETRLEKAAALIRDLRRASRNAEVAILVGGPLFIDHPEYAEAVGADAGARDAREACRVAERLVAARRSAAKPLG